MMFGYVCFNKLIKKKKNSGNKIIIYLKATSINESAQQQRDKPSITR